MKNGFLAFLIPEDIYAIRQDQPDQTDSSHVDKPSSESKDTESVESPAITQITYTGKATNRLCILIRNKPEGANAELLGKMLSAVKHQLSESALVVVDQNSRFTFEELEDTVRFDKVLFFGEPSLLNSLLNKTISPYFPMLVKDRFVISANDLSVIAQDVNQKKQLWDAMKKVFR